MNHRLMYLIYKTSIYILTRPKVGLRWRKPITLPCFIAINHSLIIGGLYRPVLIINPIIYQILTKFILANALLIKHSISDEIKDGWNYTTGANGDTGNNQCIPTWSTLSQSVSPGSLWCTSSREGNRGTPSPTGWNCRQSFLPGSSCPVPDPWPCPAGAVPGRTRAWLAEEDAVDAWLRRGKGSDTAGGEKEGGRWVQNRRGLTDGTGPGSCDS